MASEIEMSAANYALLIFYDSCVVFLAVCVLPKNSREKLCVLHLSNKRANGVHRTDCVSVHKTNRRDTDWAREHGTAHTTFNKTIKHKFSMLQPLSSVPGEQNEKMSRPTWDRMRHNSITDCAIVRVSPATTKEKKTIDTIVLDGVIRLHCGRCRIDNFYGSSIVLFRLNQQVHMGQNTASIFISNITSVFVWHYRWVICLGFWHS